MVRALVSVPLPGFSGLRRVITTRGGTGLTSFSPVAGIQWVETLAMIRLMLALKVSVPLPGFSGLRRGGFQALEWDQVVVSVPLPGFSGLRRFLRPPRIRC